MKLKPFFIFNSIVAILFGIGFTIAPATMANFYGVKLTAAGLFVGQLFGAALIGFAILTWYGKDITEPAGRNAITTALLLSNLIGLVISIVNQLAGVVNAVGWSTVAIYAILALGFAYFRLTKTG